MALGFGKGQVRGIAKGITPLMMSPFAFPPTNPHLVPLPRRVLALVMLMLGVHAVRAQQIDPRMYSELRWRMIGPFRASRTKAAVGIQHIQLLRFPLRN